MRIAIVGIGGIGGYFGAKLAGRYGAEHEIIFVQRGRHLEAIRGQGLRYATRDHEHLVRPHMATDDPARAGAIDLALICVKSRGLEAALGALASSLNVESVVLTALNGVDIAERCRQALPERTVLPGCIYLSAHLESPGVVRQVGGAGKFYFGVEAGDTAKYKWIESLLAGAGIKAVLDPDVATRLWEKYLFVEPLATLTSATGMPIGRAVRDLDAREALGRLMMEVVALAEARGVRMDGRLMGENLALAERIPPETRTSMQLDIEAGKPAELDIFTEYVVEWSGRLGLGAPIHRQMLRSIREKAGR